MQPAPAETAGTGAALEPAGVKAVVDSDGVHIPGPEQQGIRRVGRAEIAVAAALDDQAQVVGAGEADGGGDVGGTLGRHHIGAGRRAPGVQPAGTFGEARLVGDVERVGE